MKNLPSCLIAAAAIISWTGCSGLLHQRTFIDEMDRDSDGFFRPGRDFRMLAGDTGEAFRPRKEVLRRTPAGIYDGEESGYQLEEELKAREDSLSEREYASYRQADDSFGNISERIYYLSLPRRERDAYLEHKAPGYPKSNALHFGMSKDEVYDILGSPRAIESADPAYAGNERWVFYHNGIIKYVYFENGMVRGWSIN